MCLNGRLMLTYTWPDDNLPNLFKSVHFCLNPCNQTEWAVSLWKQTLQRHHSISLNAKNSSESSNQASLHRALRRLNAIQYSTTPTLLGVWWPDRTQLCGCLRPPHAGWLSCIYRWKMNGDITTLLGSSGSRSVGAEVVKTLATFRPISRRPSHNSEIRLLQDDAGDTKHLFWVILVERGFPFPFSLAQLFTEKCSHSAVADVLGK